MDKKAPSVAFIVPALNEEANISAAVEACVRCAQERGTPYRCYVFDDCSSDGTPGITDGLARANPNVIVIHNPRTRGLGFNYFRGIDMAKEDYALMVPGDAEIPASAIRILLDQAGKADLVIPYMSQKGRPLSRRIVSKAFVFFLNALFGLRIAYYNGPCLLRRDLVQSVPLRTDGFAYMSAILVILLKRGHSFQEIEIPLQYRQHGKSKAVNFRNIASILRTLAALRAAVRG